MQEVITRADYEQLVQIFADHPQFRTPQQRWTLIDEAFRGTQGAHRLHGILQLNDSMPRSAAVSLVGDLLNFRCLGERHSLAIVLQTLCHYVNDEQASQLHHLAALLNKGCMEAASMAATETSRAEILHLSDLHFQHVDDADNFHSQLAEDLIRNLQCRQLDGVICSGDITLKGSVDGYAATVAFLEKLRTEFELSPERVVVVPGNHDVHHPHARAAYGPRTETEFESIAERDRAAWIVGDGGYLRRDEALYRQRFEPFSKLCFLPIVGQAYPLEYEDQFRYWHWPELNLLVLGLNSAWEIDHHYTDRASIHPRAISSALDRLRQTPEWQTSTKIAVWHHPLASDEPSHISDHGFCERLSVSGFRLGLHGHIHKADKGDYRYDHTDDGRRMEILGAGTFGAPSREWRPGYPLQYQLLRIGGDEVVVETRKRVEPNGAWEPDALWKQGPHVDPLPRYHIKL